MAASLSNSFCVFGGSMLSPLLRTLPSSSRAHVCNLVARGWTGSIFTCFERFQGLTRSPEGALQYYQSFLVGQKSSSSKSFLSCRFAEMITDAIEETLESSPIVFMNKTNKLARRKKRKRMGERVSLRYR
ncbi:unnamed protein product [Amoebophrya sp. A25]|nr:unnamed protein product [Amoebophrya sp. A25]|eukprot:GSA25T00018955001.1